MRFDVEENEAGERAVAMRSYDEAWAHDKKLFTDKLLTDNPGMDPEFATLLVEGQLAAQLYASEYTDITMLWGREAADKYTRALQLGADPSDKHWIVECAEQIHANEAVTAGMPYNRVHGGFSEARVGAVAEVLGLKIEGQQVVAGDRILFPPKLEIPTPQNGVYEVVTGFKQPTVALPNRKERRKKNRKCWCGKTELHTHH